MRAASLVAVNGKLHRNGVPYPLEFGNLEQIAFVKKSEVREMELSHGLEIEPDYEEITNYDANFSFHCVCGTKKHVSEITEKETDLEILSGKTIRCNCGRTYKTSINEHDELIIKLSSCNSK